MGVASLNARPASTGRSVCLREFGRVQARACQLETSEPGGGRRGLFVRGSRSDELMAVRLRRVEPLHRKLATHWGTCTRPMLMREGAQLRGHLCRTTKRGRVMELGGFARSDLTDHGYGVVILDFPPAA